jgi:hypothetical protein
MLFGSRASMKRLLLVLLLSTGLAIAGFAAGALLAARLAVAPGDGLAGSATVAVYGLVGALIGMVAGVVLGRRLQPPALPFAALGGAAAAAAASLVVGWTAIATQHEREGAATASLPASDANGVTIPPPVPAHGAPDSLIALIAAPADSLPSYETKEYDYEESAITVYGSYQEWYLVGRPDGGRAWIRSQALGRFMPLEQLVPNRLNYLTESWDGQLRGEPGIAVPATAAPVVRSRETPANVLEATHDGTTLWFRVEVFDASPCEGGTPRVIASGWIPAWGTDHGVTAWFYSRGC